MKTKLTKTLITVGWSRTVEVEIDEKQLNNEDYLEEIRSKAVEEAGANISWRDATVMDCEMFPKIVESTTIYANYQSIQNRLRPEDRL